jgi:hypothetical protein
VDPIFGLLKFSVFLFSLQRLCQAGVLACLLLRGPAFARNEFNSVFLLVEFWLRFAQDLGRTFFSLLLKLRLLLFSSKKLSKFELFKKNLLNKLIFVFYQKVLHWQLLSAYTLVNLKELVCFCSEMRNRFQASHKYILPAQKEIERGFAKCL